MKLSQLIKDATDALAARGDLDVAMLTDTPDDMFHLEYEPWANVIETPKDDRDDELETFFAIGWASTAKRGSGP
jgi:hypothetical protein